MMASFFNRFDVRVGGVYLIIATLWVIGSDGLAARTWNTDMAAFHAVSTWKGLGFIAITTLALVFIISREMRKRGQVEQALQQDILERKRIEEQALEPRVTCRPCATAYLHSLLRSMSTRLCSKFFNSAATVVPSEAGSVVLFESNTGRIAYTRGHLEDAQAILRDFSFPISMPPPSTLWAAASLTSFPIHLWSRNGSICQQRRGFVQASAFRLNCMKKSSAY